MSEWHSLKSLVRVLSSWEFRARQLLTLLLLPPPPSSTSPRKAIDFFDTLEIYPGMCNCLFSLSLAILNVWLPRALGTKLRHFKALHKKTGIPYEEMVSTHIHSYLSWLHLFLSRSYFLTTNIEIKKSSRWVSARCQNPQVRILTIRLSQVWQCSLCEMERPGRFSSKVLSSGALDTEIQVHCRYQMKRATWRTQNDVIEDVLCWRVKFFGVR